MAHIWRASKLPKPEWEVAAERASPFGPRTCTLDWCERNYEVVWFIAEFFNTISNIGMLVLGLYGAYRSWSQRLPWRFTLAYLSLAVVGVGSGLFHGTLLWTSQLLDELPMIWTDTMFLYCVAPRKWRSERNGDLLLILCLYSFGVTAVYVYNRNALFFEVSYAIGALIIFGRCVEWYRANPQSEASTARSIIWIGALAFGGAFVLWNVDNFFCDSLQAVREKVGPVLAPLFQFHALWHFGTGYGTYLLGVFVSHIPNEQDVEEGREKAIARNSWGLPVLEIRDAPGKKKRG